MTVPAVSTLLRFEPSTLYRFVCGLVGVVAVIGFLPGVHTGTPLESARPRGRLVGRLIVVDLAAACPSLDRQPLHPAWPDRVRGHDRRCIRRARQRSQPGPVAGARRRRWRAGRWPWRPTPAAAASAVGIAISRPFAERTPLGELLADTLFALFIAALYAAPPLIWMISRPSRGDEPADARVGA